MLSYVKDFLFKKTSGVYVEGNQFFLCRVTRKFGKVIVDKETTLTLQDTPLDKILKDQFGDPPSKDKPKAKAKAGPVQKPKNPAIFDIGIPEENIFFCTYVLMEGTKRIDLDALIGEHPKASFLTSNEFHVDWVSTSHDDQPYAMLAACKKNQVDTYLAPMNELGLRPVRTEPAPIAALRASAHFAPIRGGKKGEIRVLTGKNRGLAILVFQDYPMAWQSIDFTSPAIAEDPLSPAIMSLLTVAVRKLSLDPPKQLTLVGPPISEETAKAVLEKTKLKPTVVSAPEYGGPLVAMGLALGALDAETTMINLSKTVQTFPPLMAILPRWEIIWSLLIVALALMGMKWRIIGLEKRLRNLRVETNAAAWAQGKGTSTLLEENEKLLSEADPMAIAMSDRLAFTPILEELPSLIPPDAQLLDLRISEDFWNRTPDPLIGYRFLQMKILFYSPETEVFPEAIDRFHDFLLDKKASKLFGTLFPVSELVDYRWGMGELGRGAAATFLSHTAPPKKARAQQLARKKQPKKKKPGEEQSTEGEVK